MNFLGSVILYVRDLDASVAFYRDVLGVPLKFSEHGYAEFATEGSRLGLYERGRLPELIGEAARRSEEAGPAAEVLFLVEDVDAEADRMRSLGVEIATGPVDRPWGHRTVHLLDPDGHVVEVAQEIPRTRPRGT